MSTDSLDALNSLTGQTMASQFAATALLGPFIMGWTAHFALFGCMATNAFNYAGTDIYARDTWRTKLVLWAVVALDTATVGVNVWEMFFHSTVQRRDAATLFVSEYGDAVPIFLLGLESMIVQIYLARRAARLFQRREILKQTFLCAIYLLAFVAFLASTGTGTFGVFIASGHRTEYGGINFNSLFGAYLWIAAGIDLIVTVALVFSLRRHIVGFNQTTDHALQRIINLAMRTAAFTAIISTLGAVFGTCFPPDRISTIDAVFAFTSPLGSLYALSLISTLASRKSLTGEGTSVYPQASGVPRATAVRMSGIYVQQEGNRKEVELEAGGSESPRATDSEHE
ncbi:hypothetical protein MNV49_001118 [Pseudohyphozyma bogoriensis]|nr:hypothetical protein MNV49_001118 [Pseudohyphozyma bogoriensis]